MSVKVRGEGMATLRWAIRDTFLAYIRAVGGTVRAEGGAVAANDGFIFPGAGSDATSFRGSVHITAHDGALDVTLADPAIEDRDGAVVLTAHTGVGRIDIARLLDAADTAALMTGGTAADVALTLDGSTWMGGVYAPWARMAAVELAG